MGVERAGELARREIKLYNDLFPSGHCIKCWRSHIHFFFATLPHIFHLSFSLTHSVALAFFVPLKYSSIVKNKTNCVAVVDDGVKTKEIIRVAYFFGLFHCSPAKFLYLMFVIYAFVIWFSVLLCLAHHFSFFHFFLFSNLRIRKDFYGIWIQNINTYTHTQTPKWLIITHLQLIFVLNWMKQVKKANRIENRNVNSGGATQQCGVNGIGSEQKIQRTWNLTEFRIK